MDEYYLFTIWIDMLRHIDILNMGAFDRDGNHIDKDPQELDIDDQNDFWDLRITTGEII